MRAIPWDEQINMFQVNPEAADIRDVAHMAEDLSDAMAALGTAIFPSSNPEDADVTFLRPSACVYRDWYIGFCKPLLDRWDL